MASQATVLYPNPLQSIASSAVTASYQIVGAAVTKPSRLIKIVNNSTQDVTISWDGINDHDFLPAGAGLVYDAGTNRGHATSSMDIPPLSIFVKGTAGTGNIYLSSFYAKIPNEQS